MPVEFFFFLICQHRIKELSELGEENVCINWKIYNFYVVLDSVMKCIDFVMICALFFLSVNNLSTRTIALQLQNN